jgi:hypothetical protein
MGDVLREIVFQSDWSLLPRVRESWSCGKELGTLEAKEVAIRLAAVVGAVRCYDGSTDCSKLDKLRDFVYREWDPFIFGENVLIDFYSTVLRGEEESVTDFTVGEWVVRDWEVAKPMTARCDFSKKIIEMVNEHGYTRILFELSGINDVLARMAGFKFLGVLEPEKDWSSFVSRLGLGRNYVFDKLKLVADELSKRVDGHEMHLTDREWLKEMVTKMDEGWNDFVWQRLLTEGSRPRAEVAGWTKGKTREEKMAIWKQSGFWEKLTDSERVVLVAVSEITGQLKNDRQLAEELAIGYTTFKATLGRVLAVGKGEEDRVVGTDRYPFARKTDFPLSLILLSRDCKPEWLKEKLDPLHWEIWEFVTTSVRGGYYHTWKEVEMKFGDRCNLYCYTKILTEKVRKIMEENGVTVTRQKNFRVK